MTGKNDVLAAPFYQNYISKAPDEDVAKAIRTNTKNFRKLLKRIPKKKIDYAYEEGKWTIREMLQHIIDAERVFSYRALAFARHETQRLPNFPEDNYAAVAGAGNRTIEDLVDELKLLRRSFKALYDSFTPAMLNNMGLGFKGLYSVAAIGYIVPGHQRWHLRVLEDKYYPLLKEFA